MAGKQSVAGQIVEQYCKDFPKINNGRLARKIAEEHPQLGTSEKIRWQVRFYRLQAGKTHRDTRKKNGHAHMEKESASSNVYELPEPRIIERVPFKMPSSIRKLLVFSDIHVPYHDMDVVKRGIEFGKSEGCDGILLNGDTMDMCGPSSHDPDPRSLDLPSELEDGRQFLRHLRNKFPNIPIYFKDGNHENRLERYLIKQAPVLLGVDDFELRSLLRMGEVGIQWIGDKRLFLAGKLVIIHGHEYKGAGGVNPARWLSLRTSGSIMCGHFHRSSSHFSKSIMDEISGAWSTGCMCHMSPDYSPYNQWNHGFAMVHVNKDKTFEVENKMMIGGKVR